MKKIVYSVFGVSLFFVVNIGVYVYSDFYKNFIQNLKYGEDYIKNYDKLLSDEYFLNHFEIPECICDGDEEDIIPDNKIQENQEADLIDISDILELPDDFQEDEKYDSVFQEIIEKFYKYFLERQNFIEDYRVFGLTSEYPYPYQVYKGRGVELYFFESQVFEEIYDIFEAISQDMGGLFSLNRVNNFGKQSFYINTSQDERVRIILHTSQGILGIMIEKNFYNEVKTLLQTF